MLFVVNDLGEEVGTCTAWFKERFDGTYPLFHWLAVIPEHQGKGVAKALTVEILTFSKKQNYNGLFTYIRKLGVIQQSSCIKN